MASKKMTARERKIAKVYTAPSYRARLRYRPPWHRAVGFVVLTAGLVIVVANLFADFTDALPLPGGHSPLYLVAGVVVGGWSMWWFGWFDRAR